MKSAGNGLRQVKDDFRRQLQQLRLLTGLTGGPLLGAAADENDNGDGGDGDVADR